MIDVHRYKGHTIDYVNRRKGYIVYIHGHMRIDCIFSTVEEAQKYIDVHLV